MYGPPGNAGAGRGRPAGRRGRRARAAGPAPRAPHGYAGHRGARARPAARAAAPMRAGRAAADVRPPRSSPPRRLLAEALHELRDGHAALVALPVPPDRDRALLGLAVADDEHVRDLAQ